ncbi:hypothetical protein CYMTET_54732 [Cymbomonas tetramitiformis]|uniref:Uncharacterized protein n=1 Tax=Cymbomonas tetramitiformis TaxID=36881 RepID=A0AAE0ENG0_9CHLO|nr:hypothetical protein CYMTET_54732 [Cymbomonas tetramitiformis]
MERQYEDKEANEQLFGATFSALFTIMIHISTVIWGEAMKENQWMAGSQQFRELGMIKIWEQLCFLDETARVKSGFFSNSESEKYNLHVERGLQRVDEAKQENDTHWTWTELLFRFFNCEDKAEQQNRLVNVIRTVMKYRTLPNLAKLLGNANVDNVPMEDLVKLPSHEIGHEFFRDSVRQWSVVVKANEKWDQFRRALARAPDTTPPTFLDGFNTRVEHVLEAYWRHIEDGMLISGHSNTRVTYWPNY